MSDYISTSENTNAKALAVGGSAGLVLNYVAGLVNVRYGVPVEVTSIVLGGAFAFITQWAAKLPPPPRKQKFGPRL